MKQEHNKLVRDKVPEILQYKNVHCSYHQADDEEFLRLLLMKVHEEATELENTVKNPSGAMDNTIASDIGDLYEVLDALSKFLGLDPDHIGEIQARKLETDGGFDDRIVLEWTEDNNHSTK